MPHTGKVTIHTYTENMDIIRQCGNRTSDKCKHNSKKKKKKKKKKQQETIVTT